MLLLSQPSGRTISTNLPSPLKFANTIPSLFTNNSKARFFSHKNPTKRLNLTLVNAEGTTKQTPQSPPPSISGDEPVVFVGQESVPLEGVIQFEKPSSPSKIDKWGRVALLTGGDVVALLLFSTIGRFSHGLSVFDVDTLRTADPFIAGWFLSAYFLGGYSEDGRGMNGLSKAVAAAAKSWCLGIPLGILIRAAISGNTPQYMFILVTMGSTAVLLLGWRALLFSLLPFGKNKNNDVYRRGSPFQLFEKIRHQTKNISKIFATKYKLLTSLVRRW